MPSSSNLLRSRRFLPLFITQFLGAFNDNIFKNAFLIWFTYDVASKLNMNTQVMVTVASGLFILPFFLFSGLAGQIADKYEKSKLVQIIKLCEIAIMVFCFMGFYLTNIALLLILLFLMGTHSTFFGPLKYSLLPESLKDHELINGNALIEGGTFLAILLGTIFGGMTILHTNGIEIVSGAVILFSILGWFSSRYIPRSTVGDPELSLNFNLATQTIHIMQYAKKEESVWLSIIGASWFWFVGASFLSQFPFYTKEIIHGDETIVTLFLSVFSIGIGVGSILCNHLLKGKINGRLVPLGSLGITLGIFTFCVMSFFYLQTKPTDTLLTLTEFLSLNIYSWGILFGLTLIALFSGLYIVPLYAIMQHRTSEKYVSRVIAANNILNALFMVASSLILLFLFHLKLQLLTIFLIIGIVNIFIFFIIRKIVHSRLYHA
jgi:acyl-[acyl-carrier-protein]-phospholipid O-acyltransferase/long-chain-fatty-acid--[acyl-carrier-protein] ligase